MLIKTPHENFQKKMREDNVDHCPGLQQTYRLVNKGPEGLTLDTPEHRVSNETGDKWVSPRGCPERDNDENYHLLTKKISEQWTRHNRSPQMDGKGYEPSPWPPMHNKKFSGPQMAIPSLQSHSKLGSCSRLSGESRQHLDSAVNVKHSYRNVVSSEILMDASVCMQRGSMSSYSPCVIPKAPDKHACHIDDRQNAEVYGAPQIVVVDGVESHPLNQQNAYMHQWSLCDSHHTTCDATHEHIAERGRNGVRGLHTLHDTCPGPI